MYYNNTAKKWYAYIKVNTKAIHLGSFVDKNEAINARKLAEQKYFGEFVPSLALDIDPYIERQNLSDPSSNIENNHEFLGVQWRIINQGILPARQK